MSKNFRDTGANTSFQNTQPDTSTFFSKETLTVKTHLSKRTNWDANPLLLTERHQVHGKQSYSKYETYVTIWAIYFKGIGVEHQIVWYNTNTITQNQNTPVHGQYIRTKAICILLMEVPGAQSAFNPISVSQRSPWKTYSHDTTTANYITLIDKNW